MTDRKQVLIGLRDKVRAGGEDTPDFSALVSRPITQCKAGEAYRGSLDAAKALHEAVFRGWEWGVTENDDQPEGFAAFVAESGNYKNGFEATNDTPARAWLLAILEALIAEYDT